MTKCFCGVSEEEDTRWIANSEAMKRSKDYQNQYGEKHEPFAFFLFFLLSKPFKQHTTTILFKQNHHKFITDPSSHPCSPPSGLSRSAIFHQVEASLARLQTPYIDLLQIHRYDPTVPHTETMKALHDLVQSGKVRYLGASSMWTYQFARMQTIATQNGWTPFISMQNHYNLCYREEEREMNKYCNETGVGLIPWSPLFGGKLARAVDAEPTTRSSQAWARAETSEADTKIIERVGELAEKKGWKRSQVALVWVRMKGAVPIVGFNKLERIEEACGVRGKVLTEEEVKYLEEPYVPKPIIGHT